MRFRIILFPKYRSMDDKCCSLDANDDDVGEEIRIKVGICAMNKKVRAYIFPMFDFSPGNVTQD